MGSAQYRQVSATKQATFKIDVLYTIDGCSSFPEEKNKGLHLMTQFEGSISRSGVSK